ncbi:MAG: hypothetical protein PHR16_09170 [Methylovulum sp.]|nr:hypothetical protein [Methylovulum sp.]
MNTATFTTAQLQQLSKEGYLGTWRFERWLNVISAVEGFLPKLRNYEFEGQQLFDLVANACNTANIRKGLIEVYGCERKADIAFYWWCDQITDFILNHYRTRGLIKKLIKDAMDDSEHSGWGELEVVVSGDVEYYYKKEQERKAA